ncbi:hypothetical protein SDC9_192033 [bioreactor metagenome]|uniref:Uncharacterized protein n=1 Tax=bioreactor metagenome TaxID=1076179 RepID=A0A645HZN9_9ZZZZ
MQLRLHPARADRAGLHPGAVEFESQCLRVGQHPAFDRRVIALDDPRRDRRDIDDDALPTGFHGPARRAGQNQHGGAHDGHGAFLDRGVFGEQ